MYTISDINTYFETLAHQLKYVGHTIGATGAAKKYARFDDQETMSSIISGMGFPRMVLSGLPTGSVSGNSGTIFTKLAMSLEIVTAAKKDDFDGEMQVWNDTRAAMDQIVARIKDRRSNGTCDELELRLDFNSIRYELIKDVTGTGATVGTRMSFSFQSSLTPYDSTAWQI